MTFSVAILLERAPAGVERRSERCASPVVQEGQAQDNPGPEEICEARLRLARFVGAAHRAIISSPVVEAGSLVPTGGPSQGHPAAVASAAKGTTITQLCQSMRRSSCPRDPRQRVPGSHL